jgi:hypothetical protein
MSLLYRYRSNPFSFPLGCVDPGLIYSIFTRARPIFLMISSTVALQ